MGARPPAVPAACAPQGRGDPGRQVPTRRIAAPASRSTSDRSQAAGEDAPCKLRVQGRGGMHALTQIEGCQHRPPGMILLGHRRAKHSREALTGRESEGARIGLHHLLDQSHHRLEQAIPALRAQPCRQGRRLGQRSAENSHQLVFLDEDDSCGRRLGGRGGGQGGARRLRGNLWDGQRRWHGRHRRDEPIAAPTHRLDKARGRRLVL